ncbi:MAG: hypothetical protein KDC44_05615, partial [Phaeodactylibacter sp.]|nr:hypothetical protein [Phaeodactylibacter sp.]
MKRQFLILICILGGLQAFSQTTELSGKVQDAAGIALEFVNIAVLDATDQLFITGNVTELEGQFSVQVDGQGAHL